MNCCNPVLSRLKLCLRPFDQRQDHMATGGMGLDAVVMCGQNAPMTTPRTAN